MNDEKRLINIETKLAHQEFLLEELNQVVYKQHQYIEEVEKKMSLLIKRVEAAFQEDSKIKSSEKPPHY